MKVSIKEVSGVGKKYQEIFNSYNIFTSQDLILYFPKKYLSFKETSLLLAVDKTEVTVVGEVASLPIIIKHRNNLESLRFKLLVDNELYNIVAYRRGYLKESLKEGMEIQVRGQFKKRQKEINAINIILKPLKRELKPNYQIDGIYDSNISKIVYQIYQNKWFYIAENLPSDIIVKRGLLSRYEMVRILHFPSNKEALDKALYRLKYEEAFFFQEKIYQQFKSDNKVIKKARDYDLNIVKEFIERIPFELTDNQKAATNDLFKDFKAPHLKKRLIQGDVGSGKTIVVGIAIYGMKTAGFQSAFMAPTEILAFQHYQTFLKYFPDLEVALLTSSTKEKSKLKASINSGEIDLVVGTHALITDDTNFSNLGFVVIDEQHRFGVLARETLANKGEADLCYLTATPIPRTLGTVILGDMEISNIKEKPRDRKPIITYYLHQSKFDSVIEHLKKEINLNHNAYVVMPSIESETRGETVYTMYERLAAIFYDKVLLIHGKLPALEKEAVMATFKNNKGMILVSTTVVEVGVDVKEATMMIIYDGKYFGLSQLHQLRGRVGRSELQSYCYVLSDDSDLERLTIFKNTDDGFLLSEYDLEHRGPGEFLGLKQSGMIDFKYANLNDDFKLFLKAKEDVFSK